MTNQNIFIGACLGVIIGSLVYAILTASAYPDVWFSHSTGDCVKVLNYAEGDNYTCENLPSSFYHVWVE